MSFKTTLLGTAAAMAVLAGSSAMAAEPVKLTESQLDDVTAGAVAGWAGTGPWGAEWLGAASVVELGSESDVELSEDMSLSGGLGGFSASYSGKASAEAETFGSFSILVGGAVMESLGTGAEAQIVGGAVAP